MEGSVCKCKSDSDIVCCLEKNIPPYISDNITALDFSDHPDFMTVFKISERFLKLLNKVTNLKSLNLSNLYKESVFSSNKNNSARGS